MNNKGEFTERDDQMLQNNKMSCGLVFIVP